MLTFFLIYNVEKDISKPDINQFFSGQQVYYFDIVFYCT